MTQPYGDGTDKEKAIQRGLEETNCSSLFKDFFTAVPFLDGSDWTESLSLKHCVREKKIAGVWEHSLNYIRAKVSS